ncbi:hypothetical protein DMB44_03720 [Thermoplasma sp. Kam2015]|nr:hypothetical protein DMB44_03720 [Thermoplasma sp. Kam2015]
MSKPRNKRGKSHAPGDIPLLNETEVLVKMEVVKKTVMGCPKSLMRTERDIFEEHGGLKNGFY